MLNDYCTKCKGYEKCKGEADWMNCEELHRRNLALGYEGTPIGALIKYTLFDICLFGITFATIYFGCVSFWPLLILGAFFSMASLANIADIVISILDTTDLHGCEGMHRGIWNRFKEKE